MAQYTTTTVPSRVKCENCVIDSAVITMYSPVVMNSKEGRLWSDVHQCLVDLTRK
jgi:hypothetical protein